MIKSLGAILIIVGYAAMGLAFVSSIGYGLWMLSTGVAFGMAGWAAFKLWVTMLGGGLASLIVGGIMGLSK